MDYENKVKSHVEKVCNMVGETLKENPKVNQVDYDCKEDEDKMEFTYLVVGDQKEGHRNKKGSNWVKVILEDYSWEKGMTVVLHYYDDGMTGVEKERKSFQKPLELEENDIVKFVNNYF